MSECCGVDHVRVLKKTSPVVNPRWVESHSRLGWTVDYLGTSYKILETWWDRQLYLMVLGGEDCSTYVSPLIGLVGYNLIVKLISEATSLEELDLLEAYQWNEEKL